MQILCEAVSFGFGPVGKLIAIAELLNKKYKLDFIGSGCSFDLAKRSKLFNNYYNIDTTSSDSEIPVEIIDKYDVIISVINPIFGQQVLKRGKKLVVIDSLFYMWHSLHPVWKNCNLLIIQSFNKEEERIKNEYLTNAFIVGPIISNMISSKISLSNERLVLNFGGADYPYISDSDILPKFIKSLAINLSNLGNFSEKTIAIGPRYLDELNELLDYGYSIKTFSHKEFMKLIRKSKVLMTVPGLTSTFEAFSLSIPVLFLPPLNYSQFLNLQILKNYGVAEYCVNWNDIYNVPEGILEEKQGVSLIESFLSKSIDDNSMQNSLKNIYTSIIKNDLNLISLIDKENQFFERNGGIGTGKAIKLIEDLVNG